MLWIGLAIALAALDKLLGLPVRREWYPDLLVILAFAVHPWFVLAGVPADFDRLETLDDYPLGLKVFAQYVLIPLVSVYLVILTAYLGRVIVTRAWPSGWIGWLVSSVSAAGVLALLLVHPARDRADSRWVDQFGRWFFVALLPSLGMLLVAAGKRIGQYGVTEPRYFLVVLAVWMLGLALYYGVTASRNIKLIPETLAVVALLAAVGPWSAFAVSTRSQVHRFQALFPVREGQGPAGPEPPRSDTDRREAAAILRYLGSTHGVTALARATGLSRDSLVAWGGGRPATIRDAEVQALRRFGIDYVAGWDGRGAITWQVSAGRGAVDVAGYDRQYPVGIVWGATSPLPDDSLVLRFDADRRAVVVERRGEPPLTLPLGPAIDSLAALAASRGAGLPDFSAPLAIEAAAGDLAVRLVLTELYGTGREAGSTVASGSGFLLVKRR